MGALAGIFQAQFAVFAVASWVAPREAAYLGFAVQIFALAQGLFIAARRGLTPILSELEAGGETGRLASWGGLMMRYWTAALCLATVAWGLIGRVRRRARTHTGVPSDPRLRHLDAGGGALLRLRRECERAALRGGATRAPPRPTS